MKKKVIIMLLSISIVSLTINLTGCTNKKSNLSQSMVVTDDVKVDTEPKLKIVSNEIIYFEEPLTGYGYDINIDEDNNRILNYINLYGNKEQLYFNKIVIEDNQAKLEYLGADLNSERSINIQFNMKKISDTSYLISNEKSFDQYEIDVSLIDNEKSLYMLIDNILIEYVYGLEVEDKLIWTNLLNNENGMIDIPYKQIDFTNTAIVNNKLFLQARLKDETINNDSLIVLDLKENKIEKVCNLGEFSISLPIDDERILIISLDGYNSALEIYNLNNNTKKELIKYENPYRNKGDQFKKIDYLKAFKDREKIYYCEVNMDKLYIKLATINGMEIEDPIILYETDYDSKDSNAIPEVRISKNEREVVIYNYNTLTNSIDSFNNIKLNK